MDVAQYSLFDPGDFHHCGDSHSYHRHSEHRRRVACASQPAQATARTQGRIDSLLSFVRLKPWLGNAILGAVSLLLTFSMLACAKQKTEANEKPVVASAVLPTEMGPTGE